MNSKRANKQNASNIPKSPLDSTSNQKRSSNSREREKMQSVNSAFSTLRTLVPTEPLDRKLSKIETLRLASSYIIHLSSHLLVDSSTADQRENDYNAGKICTFCLAEINKMRKISQYNAPKIHITTAAPHFVAPPGAEEFLTSFYAQGLQQ